MQGADSIEISAKTLDEATAEAIAKLNVPKEEVKITVIDAGSKGFLGIGFKPAKVLAEIIYDPEGKAKKFLRELAVAMGVSAEFNSEMREKSLYINITGENIGVFIGKRGQTLDSLQYLVNLAINKGRGSYTSVTLDSENYRQRRKETLEALSINLAKKAKSTQRPVVLEPMTSAERRIIHSTLQGDRYVSTYSEGDEPFRNIVIMPNKDAGFSKRYDKDKAFGDRKFDSARPAYKKNYRPRPKETTGLDSADTDKQPMSST